MITKKVNRYYCEFCKKGGQHSGMIRRHEMACTLNPKRVCFICKNQRDFLSLVVALGLNGVSWVESLVDGCPACLLSVIQLRNKEVRDDKKWDFNYADAKDQWNGDQEPPF